MDKLRFRPRYPGLRRIGTALRWAGRVAPLFECALKSPERRVGAYRSKPHRGAMSVRRRPKVCPASRGTARLVCSGTSSSKRIQAAALITIGQAPGVNRRADDADVAGPGTCGLESAVLEVVGILDGTAPSGSLEVLERSRRAGSPGATMAVHARAWYRIPSARRCWASLTRKCGFAW